jgi:MFS family permease
VFAGWLSDKVGRKTVVVSGLIFGAVITIPAFNALQYLGSSYQQPSNNENLLLICAILACLSLALALVVGPQTAFLAELFPAKSRNSAATLPHNLAAGWIGGLLPLIVTWLNQQWGTATAGLWYPTIFLASAGVTALLYLPETKKVDLNT